MTIGIELDRPDRPGLRRILYSYQRVVGLVVLDDLELNTETCFLPSSGANRETPHGPQARPAASARFQGRAGYAEGSRGFESFPGTSIPYDYRSYIVYGYTILSDGVKVPSRFTIDTRSPTLLVAPGLWHIAGTWYYPFESEALHVLGVPPEETRPFMWSTNVPIETVEEPPYREGQILHSRVQPVPYRPPPPEPRMVLSRRGGRVIAMPDSGDGWLALVWKLLSPPDLRLARDSESESLRRIELEKDEIVLWSWRSTAGRRNRAAGFLCSRIGALLPPHGRRPHLRQRLIRGTES